MRILSSWSSHMLKVGRRKTLNLIVFSAKWLSCKWVYFFHICECFKSINYLWALLFALPSFFFFFAAKCLARLVPTGRGWPSHLGSCFCRSNLTISFASRQLDINTNRNEMIKLELKTFQKFVFMSFKLVHIRREIFYSKGNTTGETIFF